MLGIIVDALDQNQPMKKLVLLASYLAITACIPIKFAPKFKNEDYKVMVAKKFQKKMPKETAFIFKDSKDAEEFYNYINKKYRLNHVDVGYNVPFQLNGETLYLSYHEAERTDEALNLPFVVIDAKRESSGNSPIFEDNYISRKGHWYILITIYDENLKNCLHDRHPLKDQTLQYLRALQEEYLNMYNYEELLFTKKS